MYSLSYCWICLRDSSCIESCSLQLELRFAFFCSLSTSSELLAMMKTVLMMMNTAATLKVKLEKCKASYC